MLDLYPTHSFEGKYEGGNFVTSEITKEKKLFNKQESTMMVMDFLQKKKT